MEAWVFVILVGAVLALLWVSARASMTICVAEIVDGSLTVTRGAIAPRVLGDLRDVAARPPIPRATLRIIRAKTRARIEVRGTVSEAQLQQFRNVVGIVPLARLVASGARR